MFGSGIPRKIVAVRFKSVSDGTKVKTRYYNSVTVDRVDC